jgi:class 3 adenylate cyclase
MVERYFGSFLDEILKRGGDVNETAGDGLMVIFQEPDPRQHARAAVKTALGILRRTHEINAKLAELAEPIALHVGVNTGVATVGATKIEGRAGTRWVYTASGSVTNVAARLAALAEGGTVMVGAETRNRLDGEFPFEALGERRLRNVEQPVSVYRLAAPGPAAADS